MSPVLELRSVDKSFPGPVPTRVLTDVSLAVDHGETVAVVGPSGSGKSTLLSIMGTLSRPDRGEVLVNGRPTAGLKRADVAGLRSTEIGFVFQQFHLVPGLTALANVELGLLYQDVSRAERRDRSAELLTQMGLEHRLHHTARHLSGGERQRVAVARALVGRPSLVLADEPTGNLDSHNADEIVDLLAGLNQAQAGHEATTLVMITHDQAIADRMQRRIDIFDGRVSP